MTILEEIAGRVKINGMGKRIGSYLARSSMVIGLYMGCGGDGREPCDENGGCPSGYECVQDCTGPCGEPVSCEYVCEPEPCRDCHRAENSFENYTVDACLQK